MSIWKGFEPGIISSNVHLRERRGNPLINVITVKYRDKLTAELKEKIWRDQIHLLSAKEVIIMMSAKQTGDPAQIDQSHMLQDVRHYPTAKTCCPSQPEWGVSDPSPKRTWGFGLAPWNTEGCILHVWPSRPLPGWFGTCSSQIICERVWSACILTSPWTNPFSNGSHVTCLNPFSVLTGLVKSHLLSYHALLDSVSSDDPCLHYRPLTYSPTKSGPTG